MTWEIIGGVLLSLLASELYDSCPRLMNLLLRSASRRLPAECRDRYWEEWMGELDAQGDLGKLEKLGWAFWVFLSSGQTGRTLQVAVEQAKRSGLPDQQQEKGRASSADEKILTTAEYNEEYSKEHMKAAIERLESEWRKMQMEDAKFPGSVKSSRAIWPWSPKSGPQKAPNS